MSAGCRLHTVVRVATRRTAILMGVSGLVAGLLIITWSRMRSLEPVQRFGSVRVGGRLPSFEGVSRSGTRVGPTRPAGGRFYVHVVDERLPTTCLDLECGDQARAITDRGGHLIGGSDLKYGQVFGVRTVKATSLFRRALYRTRSVAASFGLNPRVSWWRLETSLVVVANREGRVVRIYRHAGITDLPRILADSVDRLLLGLTPPSPAGSSTLPSTR